jgi:hypothetical protein
MSANAAIVMIGLWLCYRAIFSIPAGEMGDAEIAAAGMATIALAAWARRSDAMLWPSATNIALGGVVMLLAAVGRVARFDPLAAFWIILLAGIALAIVALWSILYRPIATIAVE